MKETMIIIPSLDPDEKIIKVVKSLKEVGFNNILVINDGSSKETLKYFEVLKKEFGCDILSYENNLGKGNALKLGYESLLKNKSIKKVISVDGDGQHIVNDVVKVNNNIEEGSITIGTRTFGKGVPFRSRLGNKVSSIIFSTISKRKITDTQSGLRGIMRSDLDKIIRISGSRFEYEMNVLLNLKKISLNLIEIPIETIYIDNNKTSHYKVIKDSFKIFKVIIKNIIS